MTDRSPTAPPDTPVRFTLDGATETAADPALDPSLRGDHYCLLVRSPDTSPRVVELRDGDALTIGRSPEATICVDDARLSRMHARVRRQGTRLTLEDLGSRNGTRLGGEIVRRGQRALAGGDVMVLGSTEIVVAMAAPSAAAGRTDQSRMIVADDAMVDVLHKARRLAQVTTTVLIHGETGSGKEVVADQIHRMSPRAAGPFVRLNCASIPEALLESELFGHEKAAFTGADRRKVGFMEAASGGTLLLDEIGELPPSVQAKLLRALETRRIVRLGGTQEMPLDVRFLCATHRDLQAEVAAGRFRQDLYYRVSTFVLEVPPLRERRAEIALLADSFARELTGRSSSAAAADPLIAPDALRALLAHPWPGNVRELRNAVEHAVVLCEGGPIRAEHLPASVRQSATPEAPSAAIPASEPAAFAMSPPPRADRQTPIPTLSDVATPMLTSSPPPPEPPGSAASMPEALASLERRHIEEALAAENGNRTRTAQRLGISRRALHYKLEKYGIGR